MNLKIEIPDIGVLDLFEETKIPVRLRNPMFNDIGSHSFTFSVPNTLNNRSIFNYSDRVSRIDPSVDLFDFRITYKGVFLYEGRIKITDSDTKGFNCYLQIAEGALYAAMQNITINKLDDTKYTLDKATCFDAEYNTGDFHTGMINNVGQAGGVNDIYNEIIADSKFLYATDNTAEPYGYNYPIPFFKVYFLIAKIAEAIGYTIEAPMFDRQPELYNLVVVNASSYNNHITAVNYLDGIPEYEVKPFIKDLVNTFNLFFILDENRKKLIIENVDFILNDGNIISSNKIRINKISRIEEKGHTLKQEADDNDSLSTELEYITLFGSHKNTTKMGPIPMIQKGLIMDDIVFSIDNTEAPGGTSPYAFSPQITVLIPSFDIADADKKKINPRLMFHRGLQDSISYAEGLIRDDDSFSYPIGDFVQFAQDYINGFSKYPFLTQGVLDANGVKIADADISLAWEGDYGLINHFWADTLYWEINKKVKAEGVSYFNEKELATFDILAKYIIDNNKYIISEMDFNLEANSISPAKVVAFKI